MVVYKSHSLRVQIPIYRSTERSTPAPPPLLARQRNSSETPKFPFLYSPVFQSSVKQSENDNEEKNSKEATDDHGEDLYQFRHIT